MSAAQDDSEYVHDGHLYKLQSDSPSTDDDQRYEFRVIKAKKGALNGTADLDQAYITFVDFPDFEDFVYNKGKYKDKYQIHKSLHVGTYSKEIVINQEIDRSCDISIEATKVTYAYESQKDRHVALKSNKGDVTVSKAVNGKGLAIDSAGHINLQVPINLLNNFEFEAVGDLYCWGALVNAENIVGEVGGGIYIVSYGSQYAKDNKKAVTMGKNTGMIARSFVSMKAKTGNIENHGAKIAAGKVLFLVSEKGDVIGVANEKIRKGKHDIIKQYIPALFHGGTGVDNQGVGLIIFADGKFKLIASHVSSQGINQISAKKGFEGLAKHHKYIAKKDKEHSVANFHKKYKFETQTDVYSSVIFSPNGSVLISEEGGALFVAAQLLGRTKIVTRDTSQFYGLEKNDEKYSCETWGWGLKQSETDQLIQQSQPTLLADDVGSYIESLSGDVDFTGAYITGKGYFISKAPNGHVIFGRKILDQQVHQRNFGPTVSVPGMNGYNAYQSTGNVWEAFSAENSTLSKINQVWESDSTPERLAAISNLGINIYNTVFDDYKSDPVLGVGFKSSKTSAKFQTLGYEGLNRGGFLWLEAGKGVKLLNGVVIRVDGYAFIKTPILELHFAALKSTIKHQEISGGVGLSLSGKTEASASFSSSHTQSTHHAQASLSVGQNVHLEVDQLKLNGATVTAPSGSGKVGETIKKDTADIVEQDRIDVGGNTNGNFSIYRGKGRNETTPKKSEINAPGLDLGKITEDRPKDKHGYNGFGISGNLKDFVSSEKIKPSKHISTANVTLDFEGMHISLDVPLPGPSTQTHTSAADVVIPEVVASERNTTMNEDNLKPLIDTFMQSADQFDQHASELDAEIEAYRASGPGRSNIEIKQVNDQKPVIIEKEIPNLAAPIIEQLVKSTGYREEYREMSAADNKFKEDHPFLYYGLYGEGENAASEFLNTAPVVEAVVNGLKGAAADLIEQGKSLATLVEDVAVIRAAAWYHKMGEYDATKLDDYNNAKSRMEFRMSAVVNIGYEVMSFIGDFGAQDIYASLMPIPIYDAASSRMSQRFNVLGSYAYNFLENPLENATRLITDIYAPIGILKGISYINNQRRLLATNNVQQTTVSDPSSACLHK